MTHNDLKRTITQALDEMKKEQGDTFDLKDINLAELERRTGISRAKLRRLNHIFSPEVFCQNYIFSTETSTLCTCQ